MICSPLLPRLGKVGPRLGRYALIQVKAGRVDLTFILLGLRRRWPAAQMMSCCCAVSPRATHRSAPTFYAILTVSVAIGTGPLGIRVFRAPKANRTNGATSRVAALAEQETHSGIDARDRMLAREVHQRPETKWVPDSRHSWHTSATQTSSIAFADNTLRPMNLVSTRDTVSIVNPR
jgi:hypothetical protein